MYILLCGQPPFNGISDKLIRDKTLKGTYSLEEPIWESVSDNAKDLLKKLLTVEPEERITASDALTHPWFDVSKVGYLNKMEHEEALKNLKTFRADEKLKQATCAYIASQLLTKKEKDALGTVFKQIDKNGDGKLSMDEIKEGYHLIFGNDIDESEVMKVFESVDLD